MAGEFKIKTGLLLGPAASTQPVTSIKDTSISITSDASSLLVTGKAVYDFTESKYVPNSGGQFIGDVSISGDLYLSGISEVSTNHILFYNTTSGSITYADESVIGISGPDNKLATFKSGGGLNDSSIFVFHPAANSVRMTTPMGTSSSTQGYSLNVEAGSGYNFGGIGGDLNLYSGRSFGSDKGGNISIIAGMGFPAGDVSIFPGSPDFNGDGGNLYMGAGKRGPNSGIDGSLYILNIAEASTNQILFYDSASGSVTYADASIGGGGGDSYWTLDGSTLVPTDSTVDVKLGQIEIDEDAGAVTLSNMPVSSTPIAGTEESYSFDIDGSTVAKVWSEADGNGALQEYGFVVETAQYMGDPGTNGSWRFYVNSSGDLVFEKRISGTWTQKGKFTE